MRKHDVFLPENIQEESFIIMGRLNAISGFLNESKERYVDKNMVAAMLGIELNKEGESDET